MLHAEGAVRVGKFGLLGDRFHLPGMPVVARDVALVVGGVNDVGIGRVRGDVAGLAASDVIPVLPIDRALIATAGDGDCPGILLRAIHAVGYGRVGNDVVELRRGLVVFAGPVLASI